MVKHEVLRNGKLYDRLSPTDHAIRQIVASYADMLPGDTFTVLDEQGEPYYEICVRKLS